MKKIYTPFLIFSSLFALTASGQFYRRATEDQIVSVKKPTANTRRFYDYRGAIRKNAVKIHPVQLINSARFTYERVIMRKLSLGINTSFQYAGTNKGTEKTEIFAKYFLTFRAPVGMYLYTSHGYGNIANQTVLHRRTAVVEGKTIVYNPDIPFVVSRTHTFSTYIGSVGIGFQMVGGPQKRIVTDFGIGYQFYKMPASIQNPIIENDIIYGKFDANNAILGPTSPLTVRFGMGFAF